MNGIYSQKVFINGHGWQMLFPWKELPLFSLRAINQYGSAGDAVITVSRSVQIREK